MADKTHYVVSTSIFEAMEHEHNELGDMLTDLDIKTYNNVVSVDKLVDFFNGPDESLADWEKEEVEHNKKVLAEQIIKSWTASDALVDNINDEMDSTKVIEVETTKSSDVEAKSSEVEAKSSDVEAKISEESTEINYDDLHLEIVI